MIAKFIPGSCDLEGTPVPKPREKHRFRPTFPMVSYLTQPLSVLCADLDEVRRFLSRCRYVSDSKQFRTRDYWMPPEEFERRRQGDCDCAALWAWRQLLELGYEARFVVGLAGPFGACHAWVMFKQGGEWFALEPFAACAGPEIPRLHTLYYEPLMSVSWDGARVRYYEHRRVPYAPPLRELLALWAEAWRYRLRTFPLFLWAWTRYFARRLHALLRRAAARKDHSEGE
jgi:hypothetical protein